MTLLDSDNESLKFAKYSLHITPHFWMHEKLLCLHLTGAEEV